MLWVKALHVIFMVTWFAGIFYLPRLFVYHASALDKVSEARFCVMEHKLFWIIMTPGAVLTSVLGCILLYGYGWALYKTAGWLHLKLMLVGCLVAYHIYCGKLVLDFKKGLNRKSHRWFRFFNEIPTLLLFGIVILVIVKPF